MSDAEAGAWGVWAADGYVQGADGIWRKSLADASGDVSRPETTVSRKNIITVCSLNLEAVDQLVDAAVLRCCCLVIIGGAGWRQGFAC